MAIRPIILYPSQVDGSDANYPHGKAKNRASEADTSATPLSKDWVNDLWGWQQALLAAAGMTPSGSADKVGASQYLDAVKQVTLLQLASATTQIIIGGLGLRMNGDLETHGAVNLRGAGTGVTVDNDAYVNGTLRALAAELGNGTSAAAVMLTSRMVCSSQGRYVRRSAPTLDANAAIFPGSSQWFWVNPGVAGNRSYAINDTNIGDDDEFGMTNPSPSFYVTVVRPTGPPSIQLDALTWGYFKRLSGTWQKVAGGPL
jgi:hypothetical protein